MVPGPLSPISPPFCGPRLLTVLLYFFFCARPLLKSLLRVRTDAVTVELTSSSDVHTSRGDGVPVE